MSSQVKLDKLVKLINKNLCTLYKQGMQMGSHYSKDHIHILEILKNTLRSSQANEVFGTFLGEVPQKYSKRICMTYDTAYYRGMEYPQATRIKFHGGEVDNDWLDRRITILNDMAQKLPYADLLHTDETGIFDFSHLRRFKF